MVWKQQEPDLQRPVPRDLVGVVVALAVAGRSAGKGVPAICGELVPGESGVVGRAGSADPADEDWVCRPAGGDCGHVSCPHVHELVALHGQPGWVAALTPLSVDGMIVAASTTLLADSRSGSGMGSALGAAGDRKPGQSGR